MVFPEFLGLSEAYSSQVPEKDTKVPKTKGIQRLVRFSWSSMDSTPSPSWPP